MKNITCTFTVGLRYACVMLVAAGFAIMPFGADIGSAPTAEAQDTGLTIENVEPVTDSILSYEDIGGNNYISFSADISHSDKVIDSVSLYIAPNNTTGGSQASLRTTDENNGTFTEDIPESTFDTVSDRDAFNGFYRLAVRVTYDDESLSQTIDVAENLEFEEQIEGTPTPTAPTLNSPVDGATTTPNVTLEWTQGDGDSFPNYDDSDYYYYYVEVATSSQFLSGDLVGNFGSETDTEIDQLNLTERTYYWRVRATYDPDGDNDSTNATSSEFSEVRSFTVESDNNNVLPPTYTFDGYKVNDIEGNGELGEFPPIPEWEFELRVDGTVLDTTTTDGNGYYSFTVEDPQLPIWAYEVREVQQEDWQQTGIHFILGEAGYQPTETCSAPNAEDFSSVDGQDGLAYLDIPLHYINGDSVHCVFLNTEEPSGGGGGGAPAPSRSSSDDDGDVAGDQDSDGDGVSDEPEDDGEVLGEQDIAPEGCDAYLSEYMYPQKENNPMEVTKLQLFLNTWTDANLELTQQYDDATMEAVKQFQADHAGDVLAPWDIDEPTGYVYITTMAHINAILCDDVANEPLPELIPFN